MIITPLNAVTALLIRYFNAKFSIRSFLLVLVLIISVVLFEILVYEPTPYRKIPYFVSSIS